MTDYNQIPPVGDTVNSREVEFSSEHIALAGMVRGRPSRDSDEARRVERLRIINDDAGDWRQKGACKDEDPELFQVDSKQGTRRERMVTETLAKRICRECPVVDKCLESALNTNEAYGIWGGTTPSDRETLRRGGRLPSK